MSSTQPWSRAEFPSRPWRVIVSSVFGLAIVFSCAPVADAIAGRSDGAPLVMAIVVPFILVLTVFVHEMGHALGARVIGWRVHIIAVKPFAFRPAPRKIGFAPRLKTADVGGFVFTTPELFGRWTRKEGLVLIGGPAANLLWGAAALILAAHLTAYPKWSNVFGAIGLISLIYGIFNFVPMWWEKDHGTDGAQLWDLWKGRQREEAARYLAWLAGLFFDGVRPQLWPAELVARAESVFASGDMRGKLDVYLVLHYLAVGRFADARKIFERLPTGNIPEMAINYTFLLCIMDKDGSRARSILEQVPQSFRDTFFFCRSDALAHFYNDRPNEARAAALRAEMLAAKKGMVMDEEDKAILSAIKEGRPITVQLSSMDLQPL